MFGSIDKTLSALDENFVLAWVRAASTAALAAAAIFSVYEYVSWSHRIRKTRQACLKLGDACARPYSSVENELMLASGFDRPNAGEVSSFSA